MAGVLGIAPWRWCFYVGAGVLSIVWVNFFINQRNRPEDVGLAAIDDPVTAIDDAQPAKLSRDAWTNLLLVAGFYFCAKFIRYSLWSWAAYFLGETYHLSDSSAALYSVAFDVCGVPGVILTGYLSDRFFKSRRGDIALIMMVGMVITTVLLMAFAGTNVVVFVILLGAVGFTLYGPDALLSGAGAMDIGGRRHATFATATISTFGAVGAAVQEIVISRAYNPAHGLGPIFAMLFGSAAVGTLFCAALVIRNRRGGKGI
jgi:sugar phosphate permease